MSASVPTLHVLCQAAEAFPHAFRQMMLKYFASGWWATMAEVDCSGSSWNSSVSSTPIRSGSSSVEELGLVFQVRAGRVAEAVARPPVALPEDAREVGRILARDAQLLPDPLVPELGQRLGRLHRQAVEVQVVGVVVLLEELPA